MLHRSTNKNLYTNVEITFIWAELRVLWVSLRIFISPLLYIICSIIYVLNITGPYWVLFQSYVCSYIQTPREGADTFPLSFTGMMVGATCMTFDPMMQTTLVVTAVVGLSEEEQQIEALCEEERYLEITTDLAERATYEGTYGVPSNTSQVRGRASY